jgi:hypothetical protein
VVPETDNVYVLFPLNLFYPYVKLRIVGLGCLILAVMLSILMALSKYYGSGTNANGARTSVPFIFPCSGLYGMFFNSTLYTIAAETFPQHLRGYGTSVAALCQGVTFIRLGQVTLYAFDAIH